MSWVLLANLVRGLSVFGVKVNFFFTHQVYKIRSHSYLSSCCKEKNEGPKLKHSFVGYFGHVE